jgi:hypothetical protein
MRSHAVETAADRRALARNAGWGALSPASVIAGLLVAFATAALLVLAAWAVANWLAVSTNLSAYGWRRLGEIGGVGAAIVLLVAFVYGGYASGRMARRGGVRNGLLTGVAGICLAVGIAFAAGGLGAWGPISREVHRLGAPTTWTEWRTAAFITGICSVVAVIGGGLAGGRLGERWHLKLVTRAREPLATATASGPATTVSAPASVSGMSEAGDDESVTQEEAHPVSAGGE